ncbi:MAG: hypothetical protein COA96_10900 [SAR86 cluster bacterium]|uniref:DUF481 domain-containing protein n=1 Tax=SAR86 cluster bacterium TaxID=2030880 RepID=A0A2A5AYF7_9GAMM|nr:MAG: hypothetical protein COA96_10900 [SAR86 cluster bacterium]
MKKTFAHTFLTTLSIASVCLLSFASHAQKENGISTEIELGAIFTSGNTEDENVQFKGSVNWVRDEWDYGFSIDGFRSSKQDELAAQRMYYVGTANYALSEESFILTRIAHEDDRFSGYDSQSDFSVNYGRNMLTSRANMSLTVNAGVGMRKSRSEVEDFDEAIIRLAGDYDWALSDTANFNQTLSAESGNETSIFRSESSIETQILDNLSLKFSINIKHQTEVPVGREKTDTETSITFVMNF